MQATVIVLWWGRHVTALWDGRKLWEELRNKNIWRKLNPHTAVISAHAPPIPPANYHL